MIFVLVAPGLFVAVSFIFPGPLIRRAREVRNCADLQTYAHLLEDFQAAHGAYPISLSDAVLRMRANNGYSRYETFLDRYDQTVRYETNGRSFVLVSYGSDRLPESNEYWSYRGRPREPSQLDGHKCAAGADIVFTDQGCFRCCGK